MAAITVLLSALVSVRAEAAERADPPATADIIVTGECWRSPGGWTPNWAGPQVKPRAGGQCSVYRATDGATEANNYVHNNCSGNSFCTVQRHGGAYYIYWFGGCDVFDLRGFSGYWEAHNHSTRGVYFYDSAGNVIGQYAGGRRDPVRWDPIWSIRTCAY
ncbi:hypothetical protein [Asanoa siamensis]|uniref:hypothetical protein n=1 Tax=Asanoa siamensis TaxID=926357 RepID=UPI0019413214|nr:hypothetical protein [Asanoa siamensis]